MPAKSNKPADASPINHLDAIVPKTDNFYAVIETPKGSQNKFKFEPEMGTFTLHKVLPAGAVFPYDFGFIPGTQGEDGDPLDVLILMDQPAFTGCVVTIRMIGVIEAEQTQKGQTIRNDRLITVASQSNDHSNLASLKEMDENLVQELEHFFQSYNEIEGKEFKPIGIYGPKRAKKLVMEAIKAHKKK